MELNFILDQRHMLKQDVIDAIQLLTRLSENRNKNRENINKEKSPPTSLRDAVSDNITLLGSQLSDVDKLNSENIAEYVDDHVDVFIRGGALDKLTSYTIEVLKTGF